MVTKEFKFSNGDKVKDIITKQEGIITGTCFYITGCNQYLITSEIVDTSRDSLRTWADEGRLELIEDRSVIISEPNVDNGPDLPAPIK